MRQERLAVKMTGVRVVMVNIGNAVVGAAMLLSALLLGSGTASAATPYGECFSFFACMYYPGCEDVPPPMCKPGSFGYNP